ncbi:MAG: tail fiber domain-containing protein [Phycisphaeraceae bacterium]|nr:tail fiber domain-containing protein [Phycisphaerales bacterium]MCB9860270.1 tail fiber domain-containing protein [Phycisphaeraceae bacterium]
MAEYVFDNVDGSSGNIFLDSNQIFSTGDVVRVLGYYEAGDGGAALWKYFGASAPTSHNAYVSTTDSMMDPHYFELASGQFINAKMFGATGDGTSDDTTAVNKLLSYTDELYFSKGIYVVTGLSNYHFGKRLWGPGVVRATNTWQTEYFGNTSAIGTKDGRAYPIDTHGGLIIGGSGPTPNGVLLRASNEGIAEAMCTRTGGTTQLQIYTNAVRGWGTRDTSNTSKLNLESSTAGYPNLNDHVYPQDYIWIRNRHTQIDPSLSSETEVDASNGLYRIASISTSDPSITVKHTSGTTTPVLFPSTDPSNNHKGMYWTSYFHAEFIGNYVPTGGNNGVFTRSSGDLLENWGHDHNVIINGTRYEVTNVTSTTLEIANGPTSSMNDISVTFRWMDGEEYLSLLRQQAGSANIEMIMSNFLRPDFAGMRIGATGAGSNDYNYYLDYHILGEAASDDPFDFYSDYAETNMHGQRFTYMTFKDSHVGIHNRNPKAPLHIKRYYEGIQGNDDIRKELARFDVQYEPGVYSQSEEEEGPTEPNPAGERKLAIVTRNNFLAPGIQGSHPGADPTTSGVQICLQPDDGDIHFGSWDEVSSGYRFEFAGDVKIDGNLTATGVYATTGGGTSVVVDTNGVLARDTSSIRYKRDVQPLDDDSAAKLWNLEPVTYKSKLPNDDQGATFLGFIAEDVAKVDPRLVIWSQPDPETGEIVPDAVRYDRVCVLMLAALKRERESQRMLIQRLEALEARVAAL